MSFILDALRKIEREKKIQPASIDIKDKLLEPDSAGFSGKRYLLIAGTAAVVLSSAAAWAAIFYLNNNMTPSAVAEVAEPSRKTAPAPAASKVADIDGTKTASEEAAKGEEKISAAKMAIDKKGNDTVVRDDAAGRPDPVESKDRVVSVVEEEFFEAGGNEQGAEHRVASFAEEVTQPTAPVEIKSPFPETDGAGRGRDESADSRGAVRLLLEGIVYHSDPEKRSALMRPIGGSGGKMLRIGDRFEGAKIAMIDQKSVTIQRGKRKEVLTLD